VVDFPGVLAEFAFDRVFSTDGLLLELPFLSTLSVAVFLGCCFFA